MKSLYRFRHGYAGALVVLLSMAAGNVLAAKQPSSPLAASRAGIATAGQLSDSVVIKRLRGEIIQRGSACNNSILDPGETCDDGNNVSGDGCSSTCQVEAGADCTLPVPPVTPVLNPGFEDGFVDWAISGNDLFLGTPTFPFGDIGQVGENYALWFGSGGVIEVETLSQTLTIPTDATTLSFEFFGAAENATGGCDIGPDSNPPSNTENASFRVLIDGVKVFDTLDTPENECDLNGGLWAFPQDIDIASFGFNDGGQHTLTFEREIIGDPGLCPGNAPCNTNFFIDDVRIDSIVVNPVPSACYVGMCGDAILSSGEGCDDGNTDDFDGCDSNCTIEEDGYACGGGDTALDCLLNGDCVAGTISFTELVADGGMEGGSPNSDWTQSANCEGCVIENFEPICSEAFCGTDRTADGAWFFWGGGIPFDPAMGQGPHVQTMSQSVTIPMGADELTFELDTQCSSADDTLSVDIDGQEIIYSFACSEENDVPGYTPQTAAIPIGLQDGAEHVVTFTSTNLCSTSATNLSCQSNFFVDNISLRDPSPRDTQGSQCNPLNEICQSGSGYTGIEKFESGIPAGWARFNASLVGNPPLSVGNWTTTDDTDYADSTGCGGVSANWPGGNTTGGSGEAACADSDGLVEALGPDVDNDGFVDCGTATPGNPASDCLQKAYLCLPDPVTPSEYTNATITFNSDYQTASQDSCDPEISGNCPHEALQIMVGSSEPNSLTIPFFDGPFVFDHKSSSLSISEPQVLSLNLNAFADPALTDPDPALSTFYVCFHYAGVFSWYAQLDNVALRAENCAVGDSDLDGISDDTDNCLEVANPDQRDTNGDGIGNICDADLNNDCVTNFDDLGLFKAVFFTTDPDADLNGDNIVNFDDLGLLKTLFFKQPGPSATTPCPPQ